jgi:hypothetical protein
VSRVEKKWQMKVESSLRVHVIVLITDEELDKHASTRIIIAFLICSSESSLACACTDDWLCGRHRHLDSSSCQTPTLSPLPARLHPWSGVVPSSGICVQLPVRSLLHRLSRSSSFVHSSPRIAGRWLHNYRLPLPPFSRRGAPGQWRGWEAVFGGCGRWALGDSRWLQVVFTCTILG